MAIIKMWKDFQLQILVEPVVTQLLQKQVLYLTDTNLVYQKVTHEEIKNI